uniref:Uncharacterized protein n=1 Tax=Anguilla anguilla TaxID=7936 RepID=A0A0E9R9S2_ANGAN
MKGLVFPVNHVCVFACVCALVYECVCGYLLVY